MQRWIGVVLAGTRGEGDALATARGVRHRALLDVAGTPMLVRVVRCLRETGRIERLLVSIDEPEAIASVPELAALAREGALGVHRSLASPSRSVLDLLDRLPPARPVLITTADHALLTPEMVTHFLDAADASGADVVAGVVRREVIEARFPETRRTWLRFRDADVSGANLFAFRTPDAKRAAEFWQRAESFRKRPWRLVAAFGPVALTAFVLRRLDLAAAAERASRAFGARAQVVALPFAEAAIDVDRPADHELATRILEARHSSRASTGANERVAST
jgi:GTP:adenosylcobinamide-phosphate guanylyltransferase